ncbi:hypothetical protein C5L14_07290 [Labrys okinawensis]|uniref:Glycosyltransferase RgtA/B/C/D-like domain-containing protein n=1 Tax=Labrys okinawensis TaxID=346911 RepID=A0A2S9QEE5_9HYPH|nr:hypothetical protein [Labrys okinawensis]PRH87728.1 hypothetical protein C5L14_07290 [Labrys okinawensis]
MDLTAIAKTVAQALAALAIVILLASLSLGLADGLRRPEAIKDAVRQAFADHSFGDHETFERIGRHRLSHFSECVGLSTAIAPIAANPITFTLQSPALLWQPPKSICDSLRDQLAGTEQPHYAYSRYWHGYRLVTEPFLSFFSYHSLQLWGGGFLILCAFLVLAPFLPPVLRGTANRARIATLLATTALGLAMTDLPLSGLTPTHMVSLSVLLLCWAVALRKRGPMELLGFAPWAFAMGAIYNFFDFLYNPDLLAYVIGWSFLLRAVLAEQRPLGASLVQAILLQGTVIAGYFAMWAAKWGLVVAAGRIFGEQTSVPSQDFARWFAGGGGVYRPLQSLYELILESASMPLGWWPIAACLLAWLALLSLALRRSRAAGALAVLALTLLPLLVLEVKANHTIQHASFTFRLIPFALVLSLAGMAAMLGRAGPVTTVAPEHAGRVPS